jgi:hypothetical protein
MVPLHQQWLKQTALIAGKLSLRKNFLDMPISSQALYL